MLKTCYIIRGVLGQNPTGQYLLCPDHEVSRNKKLHIERVIDHFRARLRQHHRIRQQCAQAQCFQELSSSHAQCEP